MSSGAFWIMSPRSIWRLSSNLADDLLRVDLQGYEPVCDVNLSPCYAVHDIIHKMKLWFLGFVAVIALVQGRHYGF
jgi:hypothetical protein